MNGKLLHNTAAALRVVGATVIAALLVTGCGITSGTGTGGAPASSTHQSRILGRGEQELTAGHYVFDLVALDTAGSGPAYLPKIAVTLPSGWSSYQGFGVNNGVVSVSFWDVNQVYATPCRWRSKDMVDPGTTVNGLASALAKQPLRNATTPTNVTLAGVHGKYLRLSVPQRIDFTECHKGYFESWTGLGWATDRWEQGAGQVDRVWILNVDGQRLVVDANYLPSATATDRAQLDGVVHSIRFIGTTPATTLTTSPNGRDRRTARNDPWIAYSTAPARNPLRRSYYGGSGSDVYIVHPGGQPQLVAGRGAGTIWNVCPAFSPNGLMLAFGRKAPSGKTIVVLGVTRDGTVNAPIATLNVPSYRAPCPKWSSNTRLAYVVRRRVVFQGLDGSRRGLPVGDRPKPRLTLHDFDLNKRRLLSPTGKLVAHLANSGAVVVSRPAGSDRRVITRYPTYGIAGWSPDGRRLLVMNDVGGAFEMRAVSIKAPYTSTQIVDSVTVNNERSWPGYGDVSWQPSPRP